MTFQKCFGILSQVDCGKDQKDASSFQMSLQTTWHCVTSNMSPIGYLSTPDLRDTKLQWHILHTQSAHKISSHMFPHFKKICWLYYSCLLWNLNTSMLPLFKFTTVKISMYKYKGNLHKVLIHTATHLILLNSVSYNYSQNSFISLYLYVSWKNWLYIAMTSSWTMLAGYTSVVKIWYSHKKIHIIHWVYQILTLEALQTSIIHQ